MALPLAQPGRFTSSWMISARLGVRWAAQVMPTVVQGAGDQVTDAAVRGLPESAPFVTPKAAA